MCSYNVYETHAFYLYSHSGFRLISLYKMNTYIEYYIKIEIHILTI
jgi:hypothetical protein